jgi:hypothetical protein
MTNFVLLYNGGSAMPSTPAEQKAILDDWNAWYSKLGSGVIDGGNPFTPVAKTIAPDGKVSAVPSSSMASGYTVIKANSLDEAVSLARGCPVLKAGGKVSVYETFNVM